jgi:hypothetical protein
MDRWIAYAGGFTLRLHKFWRGDDDRASHTHPWWFVTFPLTEYVETVFCHGVKLKTRRVGAFRPHFRAANFEHIVLGRGPRSRINWKTLRIEITPDIRPFWTIVVSGTRTNSWGFYPEPQKFIYWRNYT